MVSYMGSLVYDWLLSAGDKKLAEKFKKEAKPEPLPPNSPRLADIVKLYKETTPQKRKAEPAVNGNAKKAKKGKNCLTNFHGMGLTTDKLRSMVKKWQTLIEANCDVKTTDGYTLRVFCIGFTRKQELSTKKTAYAQAGQVRNIRKKMIDIISREVTTTDLKDVVNKLIPDSIARDIEKACQGIYPLHDVHIRKVKVMKRPRFDLNKLMDMHGEGSGKAAVTTDAATGEAVERPEGYEPPVLESV